MVPWFALLAPAAVGAKLSAALDDILADPALEGATVAVWVEDPDGRVLYERGGAQRLVPASTFKWLTATASAHALGLGWAFETRLVATGELDGDVLRGDLVWVGGGDPSLGEEDPGAVLAEAASVLAGAGITRLDGDVIVDPSVHADPPLGAGWMWDDVGYGFSAPVTGLVLGHNLQRPGLDACEARGGRGSPLVDPVVCAATALRDALEAAGVEVTGAARVGQAPAEGVELRVWTSAPLGELLRTMLVDSDNLYAECIARALDPTAPWSFGEASERLVEVLDAAGVPATEVRVADGSGLSRYGLVTARSLVRVTAWSREQPWGGELGQRLALAGVDGTLQGRLAGTGVRAKTGSMSGVRNIVGVATDATGRELRFAVLFNGLLSPQGPAIAVQDRAVRALTLSRRGRVRRRDLVAVVGEDG
jgi:D-alanyl-D-alanine carboxypeptidase/D-alanyl-D-alanine-endopeptidase (penicillin-binding protein 4)